MAQKLKLMFDATVLANAALKNASRSGIFFASYNIAYHLMKRPDIDLSFYCHPKAQTLFNSLTEFKHIPLYPFTSVFDKWHSRIRKLKMEAKINKKQVKKVVWHYLMFLSKMCFFIPNVVVNFLCQKKIQPRVFFSPFSALPSMFYKNQKTKKYILLHDAIPFLFPQYYPEIKKGNYWLSEVVDQLKSNSACCAFSVSEQTKKDFLKLQPELKQEQITVTPLACAENFRPCSREETKKSLEKYNLPTDKRYVFSLCSLEPRKNLIRAVKAFIEFIKKNKIEDMIFILGGGHWEDFIGKLDAEIEGLGDFKNKIIKAGYIDDEDLAPLYSGAEWFVYTSQYEGFGLPPLEAMACGCPVITSNSSSLPEVVGDAGVMIDWDNDEQHITAYENYYYHPELRDENRQKGLTRAKQFSWDRTVDSMVKEIIK